MYFAGARFSKENLESASKSSILDKISINDGRTKENSALRSLVGEQPQGEGVYRTISEATSNSRGDRSQTKATELNGWEKQSFLRKISERAKEIRSGQKD